MQVPTIFSHVLMKCLLLAGVHLTISTTQSVWITQCFRSKLSISCPADYFIVIHEAHFGRSLALSSHSCSHDIVAGLSRHTMLQDQKIKDCTVDRTFSLAELCSGKNNCRKSVIFGPWLPRESLAQCSHDWREPMLYVNYQCIPQELGTSLCEATRHTQVAGYLHSVGYFTSTMDSWKVQLETKIKSKNMFPCKRTFQPVTPAIFQITVKDLSMRRPNRGVCKPGLPHEMDYLGVIGSLFDRGKGHITTDYQPSIGPVSLEVNFCGDAESRLRATEVIGPESLSKLIILSNVDLTPNNYQENVKKGVLLEFIVIHCTPIVTPINATLNYKFRFTEHSGFVDVIAYAQVTCNKGLLLPIKLNRSTLAGVSSLKFDCDEASGEWTGNPEQLSKRCLTEEEIVINHRLLSLTTTEPSRPLNTSQGPSWKAAGFGLTSDVAGLIGALMGFAFCFICATVFIILCRRRAKKRKLLPSREYQFPDDVSLAQRLTTRSSSNLIRQMSIAGSPITGSFYRPTSGCGYTSGLLQPDIDSPGVAGFCSLPRKTPKKSFGSFLRLSQPWRASFSNGSRGSSTMIGRCSTGTAMTSLAGLSTHYDDSLCPRGHPATVPPGRRHVSEEINNRTYAPADVGTYLEPNLQVNNQLHRSYMLYDESMANDSHHTEVGGSSNIGTLLGRGNHPQLLGAIGTGVNRQSIAMESNHYYEGQHGSPRGSISSSLYESLDGDNKEPQMASTSFEEPLVMLIPNLPTPDWLEISRSDRMNLALPPCPVAAEEDFDDDDL